MFLASRSGHVIHFAIEEVNILWSAGKGVLGIKLSDDDACLGGALIGSRFDALKVETTGGRTLELHRGAYKPTHRGGKGYEVVKRADLVRVLPPEVVLVDWEQVEGGPSGNGKHRENGKAKDGRTLFE